MARRALLCGCNYPGSSAELRGCINDCMAMRALLTKHFGFQVRGVFARVIQHCNWLILDVGCCVLCWR